MKSLHFLSTLLVLALFSSCIGDDVIDDEVPETLRIIASVDTLGVDDTFQFTAQYTNNIGIPEARTIQWTSSDDGIVSINQDGQALGVSPGTANITAEVSSINQTPIREVFEIVVDQETVVSTEPEQRIGTIETTSFYVLEGDFTMTEANDTLSLDIQDNYEADRGLPGLYIYLTNNPNSINGALEIGAVTVFSGAHSYKIPDVNIDEYSHVLYFCKPFRVKVGDGEIREE